MLAYINSGGPVMWLLIVLFIVIVVLIVRAALQLMQTRGGTPAVMPGSVHAILFWGVFAGVLGIYGQLAGIYRALNIIITAPEISPPVIVEGLAISFHTTLFGLVILMGAGLAWFVLFSRFRALNRSTG